MEAIYSLDGLLERVCAEHSALDTDTLGKICSDTRALWEWGIERISDPNIRIAVKSFYCCVVPKQFFIAPSSTNGTHHPYWHNRPGGIVRHLAECCVSADRLLQAFGFTRQVREHDREQEYVLDWARDRVLAATVLSDTFKNGFPWGRETVKNHGEVAAELWHAHAASSVDDETLDEIAHAVHWHYGRYTPVPEGCERAKLDHFAKITQIVHLLDMCSSNDDYALIYLPVDRIPSLESVRSL